MRVKVQRGPPSSEEPSLCVTCRYATVVKGARLRAMDTAITAAAV